MSFLIKNGIGVLVEEQLSVGALIARKGHGVWILLE